jgi:hypothetical protein
MHQMNDRDCCEGGHSGFMHILPFLAIPLAIGVMRGMRHHKFAHMSEQRREAWKNGVPPMFAEFHRRAHAAEDQTASSAEV